MNPEERASSEERECLCRAIQGYELQTFHPLPFGLPANIGGARPSLKGKPCAASLLPQAG